MGEIQLEKFWNLAIDSFDSVDSGSIWCQHVASKTLGEFLTMTQSSKILSFFFFSNFQLVEHEWSEKLWNFRNNISIRYIIHWVSHMYSYSWNDTHTYKKKNVMRGSYVYIHRGSQRVTKGVSTMKKLEKHFFVWEIFLFILYLTHFKEFNKEHA